MRTNLDYFGFEEYYSNNPGKKPDAIFIVNEEYGLSNTDVVYGDYIAKYIAENQHEVTETDAGIIYTFHN